MRIIMRIVLLGYKNRRKERLGLLFSSNLEYLKYLLYRHLFVDQPAVLISVRINMKS